MSKNKPAAEKAYTEYCNRHWKKGAIDVKTAFIAGYVSGVKASAEEASYHAYSNDIVDAICKLLEAK